MQRYELKAKFGDKWVSLDLGDDKPAMNFQVNDIAELKDRDADYSQALKLPKTNTNMLYLGMPDTFDLKTDYSQAPYKRIECRLLCDDFTLAGKGSFMVITKVTDFIEVQVLGGTADFFDKLKNLDMSVLDLGKFTLLPQGNTAETSDYYQWAAYTWSEKGTYIGTIPSYPVLKMNAIAKKIVESLGYTLVDDVSYRNNALLSLASINVSKNTSKSLANFEAISILNGFIENPELQFIPYFDPSQLFTYRIDDPMAVGGIIPKFSGSCDLTLIVQGAYNEKIQLYANNETSNFNQLQSYIMTGNMDTFKLSIRFFKGDKIRIGAYCGQLPTSGQLNILNINTDTKQVPINGTVYIADNTGYEKQLDFFKIYTQLQGLTISVDNINKIVYAYTMDKIYENKTKAIDWSSKLNVEKGKSNTLTFNIRNYAQNNKINFEDSTIDEISYTDSGVFAINNQTLEPEKELFKIGVASGKDKLTQGEFIGQGDPPDYPFIFYTQDTLANIPLVNDDGTFKGSKPHYLHIVSPNNWGTTTSILPIVTHFTAQLSVDLFYSKLINNMLVNARMYEVDLLLTSQDIQDFDQFIPIYLDYFGAYFYVNKIKNFVSGQLTKCELIKL